MKQKVKQTKKKKSTQKEQKQTEEQKKRQNTSDQVEGSWDWALLQGEWQESQSKVCIHTYSPFPVLWQQQMYQSRLSIIP